MSDDLITRAENAQRWHELPAHGKLLVRELVAALKEAHARTGHLAENVVALEDALEAEQAENERLRGDAEMWRGVQSMFWMGQ